MERVTDGKASKGNVFTEKVVDGRVSKGDVFTEKLQIERLPRATFLQKSHGWKGFQVQPIYRKGLRG